MKLYKHTPDRYFKISVESDLMDELSENEAIPTHSLEGLILELEILASELRKLLDEELVAKPN